MRLSDALKDKLLDLRLRDKLLQDGKLSKEYVGKYLESLPDDSGNVRYVNEERKQSTETFATDD